MIGWFWIRVLCIQRVIRGTRGGHMLIGDLSSYEYIMYNSEVHFDNKYTTRVLRSLKAAEFT